MHLKIKVQNMHKIHWESKKNGICVVLQKNNVSKLKYIKRIGAR